MALGKLGGVHCDNGIAFDHTPPDSPGSHQTSHSEFDMAIENQDNQDSVTCIDSVMSHNGPYKNQRLASIINKLSTSQQTDSVVHSREDDTQNASSLDSGYSSSILKE